jgi:hypothetical protein
MSSSQVIKRDPQLVRYLSSSLQHELKLHQRYQHLLEAEREAVTKSEIPAMERFSRERHELHQAIQAAAAKRRDYMANLPEGQTLRLSQWIERHCHPLDSRALMPLVVELRTIIGACRRAASELSQLTRLSLDMVNGSLSILWNATQNVFRSYTASGSMKESFHPANARAERVLKQA